MMTKRAFAEVTLDASPIEVSNSLVFIMELQRTHPRVQRISEKPQQIELRGENGISLRSWGESIKITITEEKIGSRIQAESKPKMETTLFDYGKNKENLEALFNPLIMKYQIISPLKIEEKTFETTIFVLKTMFCPINKQTKMNKASRYRYMIFRIIVFLAKISIQSNC